MELNKYFEGKKGLGILSTAGKDGRVNSAVYSKPHVTEGGKIAFIMADRLTYANLAGNLFAVYLFKEDGPGHEGRRLYLKKFGESDDPDLIDNIRQSCHSRCCDGCDERHDKKFLVYFDIEKDLPLIVKK